ncbi:FAD-dependent oxidoreductase [Phytohabitans suffuscus]|nr:FAD-dependent oxidoreductase [Phytohabitans suffuscus]
MEENYDVVVLGSGAAGLTAALAAAVQGARVAVFEKAELIGGTTALSGAGIWIPGNKIAARAGIEDSQEQGLKYLLSLSNGMILPELAEALVDGGPQLIDFLEAHTEIRLQLVPGYPDYHPEHPGGLAGGGRTLEPALVSFSGLEDWTARIAGDIQRIMLVEMPLGGAPEWSHLRFWPNAPPPTSKDSAGRWSAACSRHASPAASRWPPACAACG